MSMDKLDDDLLAKVMLSVRVEVRQPLFIRVTKFLKGKLTDSHVFEIPLGTSVADTQKEVTKVVGKWAGGFPVGCKYVVERLGGVPEEES